MNNKEDKRGVLSACFAKPQKLVDLVDYADDSVISKTLLDKSAGTVTLFAFDEGQKLSEHTAAFDAVVQVLDGTAVITIGGEGKTVSAGRIIIMPADVPHSVTAKEKFKMLLTMIRSQ